MEISSTNRQNLIVIIISFWLSSTAWGKDDDVDQRYMDDNNIQIDDETLAAEKDAKEEILEFLREAQRSTDFIEENILTNIDEKNEQATQVQGSPIDIYLFLIMPVLMASLAKALLQRYIRPYMHIKTQTTEYPLIPLIYFQQTEKESMTKRDTKRQLSSIAANFIIRANQSYINLDDIRNAAITRRTLSRSPWALVQFMIRLQILYAKQRKSEENKANTNKNMMKNNKADIIWSIVQESIQNQRLENINKIKARQILM